MKKFLLPVLAFSFLAIYLQSCTSEPEAQKEDNNSVNIDYTVTDNDGKKSSGEVNINIENAEDALKEVSKAFEGLGFNKNKDGEEVEIVNFRELKKRLPERLAGLDRQTHEGQTTGFAGFKISTAEAEYKEGNKSLKMTITDTGGLGAALLGVAAWSSLEIDKETEDGYERTTEIDGHKAFIKYSKKTEKTEVAVLYNDRVLAVASGKGLDLEEVKDLLEDMELDEVE